MTTFSSALAGSIAAAVLSLSCASAGAELLLFEDFNRPDSPSVGNGWSESSTSGDLVSLAGNRLQVQKGSPGTNLDGAIYRSFAQTSGIVISGNMEWINANPNASPFMSVNGLPNWNSTGIKIL